MYTQESAYAIYLQQLKEKTLRLETRFQDMIQSRILEGIRSCATHAKLYMSVDMAWDSLPINKSTIPLLQYAQGKII